VLAPLLLLLVTAVWGVTFVQVKDALELYPLFAFLAVRFAIASATLAPAAGARLRGLGRSGIAAGVLLGSFLALGYGLQTAGLELTTVSGTGFITGMYVVLTPLVAYLLFRDPVTRAGALGVALAFGGIVMLSGIEAGSVEGNLLVLGGTVAYAFQIAVTGRFAPHFEPLALTFVQMLTALAGFGVVAVALGELEVPRGWTVWGALVVTGVFASALAYLVQTWVQRRTSATRVAVIYAMEPVFAGFFGFALAGDRLGWLGWAGCAVILAGILASEPEAASDLRRLVFREHKAAAVTESTSRSAG
jgi:drug/metabolite transporter (DMT)-like permease